MGRTLDTSQNGASIKEVSKSLGLSCRRIQQLCSLGVLPAPLKRGKYDLTACTVAYCKYQRRKLKAMGAKLRKRGITRQVPAHKIPTKKIQETFQRAIEEICFDLSELRKQRNGLTKSPRRHFILP
jgi:hypothetical protein